MHHLHHAKETIDGPSNLKVLPQNKSEIEFDIEVNQNEIEFKEMEADRSHNAKSFLVEEVAKEVIFSKETN